MKLLMDTCVWGGACQELEAAGTMWHGPEVAYRSGRSKRFWRIAHREGRVLVTLDKDFGNWPSFGGYLTRGLYGLVNIRRDARHPYANTCLSAVAMCCHPAQSSPPSQQAEYFVHQSYKVR